MKILLCTNAFDHITNGPAKFANLVLNINDLYPEHEVRVLTEDTEEEIPDKVYHQPLPIPRVFRFAGMFIRMFLYHHTAMRIKKRDFNFDVLVYNNIIVAVRSALTFKNTAAFINDDTYSTASFRRALLQFKWNKAHVFHLVEKTGCVFTKKIIVNSEYLKKHIIQKYPASKNKVFRLYKAVESPVQVITKSNDRTTVLFVKNDYIRGGLFYLIEALKKINYPVRLIIAGMPESANGHILSMLRGVGFEYELRGIIPQREVYALMEKADIFCVPSLKEALGVANLEAMTFSCAIISSTAGGIPETTDNGACGWLVPPADADALAAALEECIGNPAMRQQKIEYAREFCKSFSVEVMLDNFLKILKA